MNFAVPIADWRWSIIPTVWQPLAMTCAVLPRRNSRKSMLLRNVSGRHEACRK